MPFEMFWSCTTSMTNGFVNFGGNPNYTLDSFTSLKAAKPVSKKVRDRQNIEALRKDQLRKEYRHCS